MLGTQMTRYKSLGVFLKKSRKRSGLSQTEVANQLGYSTPQFISNWERGISGPPISCIKKLAKFYNINEESLFKMTLQQVEKELRRQFKKSTSS